MKKLLLIVALAMLAMLVVVACSDDDECPTCPASTQQGVVIGDLVIGEGELGMWGVIMGMEGLAPDVDSILLDGDSVRNEISMEGGGNYVYMDYESATTRSSGDQVALQIFAPGGTSTCTVKLLDSEADRPQISGWEIDYPYDTIAISTAIDISWTAVASADWYVVHWSYRYDSSGTSKEIYDWGCQTTTSFDVPSSETGFNGRYSFDIVAGTGPRPDGTTGNFTGGPFKGCVNSYTGEYFSVYIGTGVYNPPPTVAADDVSEHNIRELMQSIRTK